MYIYQCKITLTDSWLRPEGQFTRNKRFGKARKGGKYLGLGQRTNPSADVDIIEYNCCWSKKDVPELLAT